VAPQSYPDTPLDVFLLDLEATLRESERGAKAIERHLMLVPPAAPASSPSETLQDRVSEVRTATRLLVAEAKALVQTIGEGRQLLRQLHTECENLRRFNRRDRPRFQNDPR
jgi:hypothetical protein